MFPRSWGSWGGKRNARYVRQPIRARRTDLDLNAKSVWLHAAPGGGAGLLRLYASICHMPNLAVGTVLPAGQLSDGGKFYVTTPLAKQLTDALQLAR